MYISTLPPQWCSHADRRGGRGLWGYNPPPPSLPKQNAWLCHWAPLTDNHTARIPIWPLFGLPFLAILRDRLWRSALALCGIVWQNHTVACLRIGGMKNNQTLKASGGGTLSLLSSPDQTKMREPAPNPQCLSTFSWRLINPISKSIQDSTHHWTLCLHTPSPPAHETVLRIRWHDRLFIEHL